MAGENKLNTYNAILLGAQAAGIAGSIFSERQKLKTSKLGYQLDQRELGLRMQEEELAFTQANNASLENLRETLATQNAILGTRGQLPGVGSALAVENKSLSNFNADKEALKLNKTFRQSQYKAMERLSGIKQATQRIDYGNKLLAQGINMFTISEDLYKKRNKPTLTGKK